MYYCVRIKRFLYLFALSLARKSVVLAQVPAWNQFLGQGRNGISPETGLLANWPTQGLEIAWRANGGVGMSAVAVAEGRAITVWNSDGGQTVAALSMKDGALLWTALVAANYENQMGNGPRATPTIAGKQVFAYTGEGTLVYLDLSTGKQCWSKSVVREMLGRPAEYGMACSPLVVDDLVIVTAGGQGKAVVALDRKSGDIRWTAVNGLPGHSSPALLDLCGESHVVAFTASGVTGLHPNDGKELWSYPFPTPYDCNTATPIEAGGNVFISAGEIMVV